MKYTDQIQNTVNLNARPQRIISLVPSQSEFLWEIGIRQELVGITKFCVHPEAMYSNVERVGGTKNLNLDKIRRLKPDLIIGNKEENDELQIKTLQKEFNVWMSDIISIDDSLHMMKSLGEILNRENEVVGLIGEIGISMAAIKNLFNKKSVAYFMWNEPYMLAANETFINSIIQHIGLKNIIDRKIRYPITNEDELKSLNPDYCFLSSEPFPFKKKHIDELKQILPDTKIILVDGEMFSWYGSRLKLLATYMLDLKMEL
jgi:ABC-type Fe3+-hydroxamate transport system substrate-binding protein